MFTSGVWISVIVILSAKRTLFCVSKLSLVPPSDWGPGNDDTSDNCPSSQAATDEQGTEEGDYIEGAELEESGNDESDSSRPSSHLSGTTASEPDPSNWENWAVGEHPIWDASRPTDCDPRTFLEQLQAGRWECLLLSDYKGNGGFSRRRFLLIVEWLENGLTQRVGALVLNKHPYYDIDEFFEHDDIEWKSVHLV
ncbi:hypothetical protein GGR57DRAFT_212753 [Xylariaceae sp. FL1272]|nr:hypothetical protein GGR57DRAFT_212753 [Xylariaceae sp. FL1272]